MPSGFIAKQGLRFSRTQSGDAADVRVSGPLSAFDDGYIGDTSSTLQRDVTATGYTGGRELVSFTLSKDGNRTIDLSSMEILLSPGDILMVAVAASSATTDVDVAMTITEEI